MRNSDKSKIYTKENETPTHTCEQIGVMQKEKNSKPQILMSLQKEIQSKVKIIQKRKFLVRTQNVANKILIESFANYIVKPIYNRFAMRLCIFVY